MLKILVKAYCSIPGSLYTGINQIFVVTMQILNSHVQSIVLIITHAQMNVMICLKKYLKKKIVVTKQKILNSIFQDRVNVQIINIVAKGQDQE